MSLATPRHATPRHATPRHATPRHATPCNATPRLATPPAHSLAQELDKVTTEVLILSTLKHANITGFYGSFRREQTLSIVMEYADGGNLADTIVRQAASGEHFATERVLGWLAQLCSALQVRSYCAHLRLPTAYTYRAPPTKHLLSTAYLRPHCTKP
jgi:serine/threonine protein kinase